MPAESTGTTATTTTTTTATTTTRTDAKPTPTWVTGAGLVLAGLGLAGAGFRVGLKRALELATHGDDRVAITDAPGPSGVPPRVLAMRAFMRGSAYAIVGASVLGAGVAYAAQGMIRRHPLPATLQEEEAEVNALVERAAEAIEEAVRGASSSSPTPSAAAPPPPPPAASSTEKR